MKDKNQIAEQIREAIVDSLVSQNPQPLASGRLASSIEVRPADDGFEVFAEDYYTWVENGRTRGAFPPIQPIMEWIKAKGLKPRGGTSTESFAYAIRYGLTKKAVDNPNIKKPAKSPARPFLQEAIDAVGDEVIDEYALNIEKQIDNIFE